MGSGPRLKRFGGRIGARARIGQHAKMIADIYFPQSRALWVNLLAAGGPAFERNVSLPSDRRLFFAADGGQASRKNLMGANKSL